MRVADVELAGDRPVDAVEQQGADQPQDRGSGVAVDHRVEADVADDHATRRQGMHGPRVAHVLRL